MKQFLRVVPVLGFLSAAIAAPAGAAGLRGSSASMVQQHEVAIELDFAFSRTAAEVRALVEKGMLEELTGNGDYVLSNVSFPYARPEIRLFVERLAEDYHAALGSRLVVTSLTRPRSRQPANAHELSVHPAGMAVDLRVPAAGAERNWLERTLLTLERHGLLDVTREYHPPHYHVAVFPTAYGAYAARRQEEESDRMARLAADSVRKKAAADSAARAVAASTRQAGFPGIPVGVIVLAVVGGLTARAIRRRTA